MRKAGSIASETLLGVGRLIRAGISTGDLDRFVHQDTLKRGARPAPLNYNGFEKSICTSRNHVVCHGIPNDHEILEEGDIINVDLTSIYEGYHGDTSATFYVGTPTPEAKHVVEVARHALKLGIAEAQVGATLGDIGAAIEEFVTRHGCSVIERCDGHGIGESFHEPPWVKHHGKRNTGLTLEAGMTFTIEPVVVLGTQTMCLLDGTWTMVTINGALSAQFEHTIAVTDDGPEILTRRSKPLQRSELFDIKW
jgi:methionyl aminopeptidase